MLSSLLFIILLITFPAQDRETIRQSEQHFARAVELQTKGDLPGARDEYEAALKLIPRRADALSNLGVVYARLGQYEPAISSYKAALALEPADYGIRLNLGLAYFQTDQYKAAQEEFAQVVSIEPKNQQAHFLLGLCLFETGKLKEAIAELEPVYNSQPGNLSFAYALANAYIQDDQIEKGQILVDQVFRDLNSAESHLILGTFNLARKQLQPAVEELRQAIEINPKLPTAHSQLAVAYLQTGNRDLAIEEFKKELAINPGDFIANTRLGWLMREDGNLDEGERLLRRALELRPSDPGPLFQLAQLVQARGNNAEAVRLLEQVTKILPDYSPAHVLLARLYFKLKRTEDARREQTIIERLTAEQQKKQPTAERQNPLLRDPKDRALKETTQKP